MRAGTDLNLFWRCFAWVFGLWYSNDAPILIRILHSGFWVCVFLYSVVLQVAASYFSIVFSNTGAIESYASLGLIFGFIGIPASYIVALYQQRSDSVFFSLLAEVCPMPGMRPGTALLFWFAIVALLAFCMLGALYYAAADAAVAGQRPYYAALNVTLLQHTVLPALCTDTVGLSYFAASTAFVCLHCFALELLMRRVQNRIAERTLSLDAIRSEVECLRTLTERSSAALLPVLIATVLLTGGGGFLSVLGHLLFFSGSGSLSLVTAAQLTQALAPPTTEIAFALVVLVFVARGAHAADALPAALARVACDDRGPAVLQSTRGAATAYVAYLQVRPLGVTVAGVRVVLGVVTTFVTVMLTALLLVVTQVAAHTTTTA